MLRLISNSFLVSAFSLLILASCNNSATENKVVNTDSSLSDANRIDSLSEEKKQSIEFKFAMTEANLPSPFEIVNDIYSYKAPFKVELLNPSSNVSNYISAFKQEVNYGIYSIDLSYINFYGQNQELLNYYSATKKIAKELNINQAFDLFANRFSQNSSNKDSVIALIDHAFAETDNYLKKNERYLAASHVLAGALIEINYLSLNLIRDVPKTAENQKLFEKVYNQKLYIYHLINLYKEYTDKDSKDLMISLEKLKKSYDDLIKSTDDYTPETIDKTIGMFKIIRDKLIK